MEPWETRHTLPCAVACRQPCALWHMLPAHVGHPSNPSSRVCLRLCSPRMQNATRCRLGAPKITKSATCLRTCAVYSCYWCGARQARQVPTCLGDIDQLANHLATPPLPDPAGILALFYSYQAFIIRDLGPVGTGSTCLAWLYYCMLLGIGLLLLTVLELLAQPATANDSLGLKVGTLR